MSSLALPRAWRGFELALTDERRGLLRLYRWRFIHMRPARTKDGWRSAYEGDGGFLDIFAVRPPRMLFAELKSGRDKLSPEQQAWMADLEAIRATWAASLAVQAPIRPQVGGLYLPELYTWTPDDLANGTIERVLR